MVRVVEGTSWGPGAGHRAGRMELYSQIIRALCWTNQHIEVSEFLGTVWNCFSCFSESILRASQGRIAGGGRAWRGDLAMSGLFGFWLFILQWGQSAFLLRRIGSKMLKIQMLIFQILSCSSGRRADKMAAPQELRWYQCPTLGLWFSQCQFWAVLRCPLWVGVHTPG